MQKSIFGMHGVQLAELPILRIAPVFPTILLMKCSVPQSRQFEIIGEAFTGLRRTDAAVAALIPELPRIIAFRNVLIHGYATVDDRLVWGVVESDLPGLLLTLGQLLPDEEK